MIIFGRFDQSLLLKIIPGICRKLLTLEVPTIKIIEFTNSVDADEADHNEQPHLDLHHLISLNSPYAIV